MTHLPTGGAGSDLAPGMTQVVFAGTKYTITDEKGVDLEIDARNDPDVVTFLHAFDHWIIVDKTMPQDAKQIRDAAWQAVVDAWEKMPGYLVRDFPSMKTAGAVGLVLPVPGHDHG